MFRPTPKALACVWAFVALTASAEPGTPSWVRAELNATSLNRLPEVELKFKGWKEKVRFHVGVTRNGQPWTHESWGGCNPVGRGDATPAFRCAEPVRPSTRPERAYFNLPGSEGYVISAFKLDWGSEYCFRIRPQDDDGEFAKLWTGWACARTPPVPPLPGVATDLKLVEVPAGPDRTGRGWYPGYVRVTWVPDRHWGDFAVEAAPLAGPADFKPVALWIQGAPKNEATFSYQAERDGVLQVRVCGINITGKTCTIARRFPPRGIKENVGTVDVPDHRPRPITSASEARNTATVTRPPPPVTSTTATKTTAESSLAPSRIMQPSSSFSRGSGALR